MCHWGWGADLAMIDYDECKPIKLAQVSAFELGAMQVRPATRQVIQGDLHCVLEPRVMQVLVALAQAGGAVVSRDELIARCWDGRVVGDNALHRAIGKVRDLGLNFGGGAFQIETISKVGYRLIASADPAPAPQAPAMDREKPVLPLHGWPARRAVMLGAGAAAVAGGAFWALRPDPLRARVVALIAQSDNAMRLDLPDSSARGAGFLEEAASLDPSNAHIWGRLALVRGVMAEYAPPEQAMTAVAGVQEAAGRALALDRRNADALAALALLPHYYGDWFAAEQRMKAVLAVDPGHLPTLDARDFMYTAVGRAREGSSSRLSYAPREPLHAGIQFKAVYAHWIMGQINEADRTAERALRLWPKHPGVWFARLWTLAFTGRAERAQAHLEDAAVRPNLPPWFLELLRVSLLALKTKERRDVSRATQAVLAAVSRGPSNSVNAIMILNGLGEIDKAFDVANAYLLERGPIIASLQWREGQVSVNDQRRRKTNMLFNPVGAPMRADPRFAKLTEDFGLAEYWRQANVVPDHLA